MDESQRRAWRALGLGPEWAARVPDGPLAPVSPSIDPAQAEAAAPQAEPPVVQPVDVPAGPTGGQSAAGFPDVAESDAIESRAADLPAVAPDEGHSSRAGSGAADSRAADAGDRHPDKADPGEADPGEADPEARSPSPARRRAIEIARLDWQPLRDQVAGCTACGLCRTRSRTVFGVGATDARWMLVGEAPGAEEDARGEPFVGKAGQLLDAMLGAIGLDRRADVFIANVLKCRPPRNRDPLPEEVGACEPFLLRQLELVAPDVVLVLGRFAAQSVLGTDASIASLRGKVHRKEVGGRSVPLVVTYHPAYLLRTPADKSKSWSDLLLARRAARESQD